jgi:hypothetical protein
MRNIGSVINVNLSCVLELCCGGVATWILNIGARHKGVVASSPGCLLLLLKLRLENCSRRGKKQEIYQHPMTTGDLNPKDLLYTPSLY